jgi:hypothetical protein
VENGILDDIAERYDEIAVFFLTFSSHPERGYSGFVINRASGPWYELQQDGSATRKGTFSYQGFTSTRLYAHLGKSHFFQKLLRGYEKMGNKPALDLHVAMLAQADKVLRQRYKTPLTVISWPGVKFNEPLREKGIDVLDLAPLFPDYGRDRMKYCVHPTDMHPNALATDIAARAVAENILARDAAK